MSLLNKYVRHSIPLIILTISLQYAQAQNTADNNNRPWWREGYPFRFAKNPKAKMMSLISVKGNKFINAKGDTVLFRGVSIADPDKIDHEGHWNKMLFEKVKDMGVMLVRIPVHPVAWRERTPLKYLSLLDSAVSLVYSS